MERAPEWLDPKLVFGLVALADVACEGRHEHLVFLVEDRVLLVEDLRGKVPGQGWALARERPCFVLPRGRLDEVATWLEKEEREMADEERQQEDACREEPEKGGL